MIEQSDRMLAPFDPDLVGWLMEKFHQTGVDVRLRTRVTAIEKSSDGLTVRAAANGKEALFEAALAVHAAGRVPDLEPLDLAAAGVTTGKGRLELNEFLQSVSNPAVYAVGDAASSGPALTPVASHDAEVAASNMLDGNHDVPNYLGVPSAAFTTPPIASVGMSEQQVCDSGMKFRMKSEKASSWYTARRVAETTYGFKVLVDESTDRILRRASDRPPLRRSDQHLRARDPQRADRRGLEDDDVRLPHRDFRHRLHAVNGVIEGAAAVKLWQPSWRQRCNH